jgi:hypothetical protein
MDDSNRKLLSELANIEAQADERTIALGQSPPSRRVGPISQEVLTERTVAAGAGALALGVVFLLVLYVLDWPGTGLRELGGSSSDILNPKNKPAERPDRSPVISVRRPTGPTSTQRVTAADGSRWPSAVRTLLRAAGTAPWRADGVGMKTRSRSGHRAARRSMASA